MTIYITCLFFRPRTVFKENISSHRLGSIEIMGTFFTLNRQIGKGSRLFFEIWNWEPIFVPLDTGSQMLDFQRSQIYYKLRSQILMSKFEIGSLFLCV